MKAYLALRTKIRPRWDAFSAGLAACGLDVVPVASERVARVLENDIRDGIFITWNRIGAANTIAHAFEQAKRPVWVVENPSWGKLVPGHWLQIANNLHNTRDRVPCSGVSRWDGLNVELRPMRRGPGETVILAQRSIGSAPVAQPRGWHMTQSRRGRMRAHPNDGNTVVPPLAKDLAHAYRVLHWASAAGAEALALGVGSEEGYGAWIGGCNNTEDGRAEMFQRMAWSQWRLEEIAEGTPFKRLLQ